MPFMYDHELVFDIFKNIASAIEQIQKRFEPIKVSSDFIKDDAGLEKLDSICMQLMAVGEALKQIDNLTKGTFFAQYPTIEWKKAMGMRDIIAHHYFDVDHETIYVVCKEHIPVMNEAVKDILSELGKQKCL
jgi:uncharacterized protein with HEPN domain